MTRPAIRVALLVLLVLAMLLAGLTVLAIAGLESGPVAFALALTLAVLPVPAYIALVLFVDRFEPEPVPMVLLTFAYGATIACLVAIVFNTVGQLVISDQLGQRAAELYGYSISAPVVEESAKGAVLLGIFLWRRSEFNGVIDGIVYAALVGLGFAMTENVLYYGRGAVENGIPGAVSTFIVRGLMSPFAHPIFTAMTGIGFGIAATARSRAVRVIAPLVGLAVAMLLHSTWNTGAGAGLFLGVYVLIMLPVLALIGLVIVFALRREGRVIAAQLRGVLPDAEVAMLSSLRGRRLARRAAGRAGGRRAKDLMLERQRAATELAFHLQQAERGVLPRNRITAARQSALAARLQRARLAA